MSQRREILKNVDSKAKKTRKFLYPILEITMDHQTGKHNYLIDVCIVRGEVPKLVLIFDNIDYEPLKMDIYKLQNSPYFDGADYGDDNKEFCLFFKVPKEYIKDFNLFTEGRYSEFSKKFKDLLSTTYGVKRLTGVSKVTGLPNVGIYDVIYPTDETKQMMADELNVSLSLIKEVLTPPDLELEEYKTIEELKELYDRAGESI